MVEMERDHGSLFRAMFARRRVRPRPAAHLSFDAGMSVLSDAMRAQLGASLVTGCGRTAIERSASRRVVRIGRWELVAEGDRLVLAAPARAASRAAARHRSPCSAERSPTSRTRVSRWWALGYRASDMPRPLDGYGYLVTRREGLATLGVVWESSLFAGRAPEGHVLVRAMLGGSRLPEVVERRDEDCLDVARAELARVMGIRAEPVHVSVHRWPQAIAQYTLGHQARMDHLRARVAALPGLHVCGTSYDGVSFNHAVKSGRAMARTLAGALWGAVAPSPSVLTEPVAV